MAQQDWQVDQASGRCAVTGRVFAEGDDFYGVLFEEGEGFRRTDFGVDAWTGPPPGAYCFFKSRVPVKEKKRRMLVDDEVLVNFFERLAEETEPVRIQFRFVLALILMRKRLLKYDGSAVEDGMEIWRMVSPKEGPVHRVINPKLNDDQIAGVSEQLGAILHNDMGTWGAPGEQADASGS
jgi:hypothetical protein